MTRDEKMFVLDSWNWGHAVHARKHAESLTRYAEGAMALSEIVDVSLAAVSLPLLSWSPLTATIRSFALNTTTPLLAQLCSFLLTSTLCFCANVLLPSNHLSTSSPLPLVFPSLGVPFDASSRKVAVVAVACTESLLPILAVIGFPPPQ